MRSQLRAKPKTEPRSGLTVRVSLLGLRLCLCLLNLCLLHPLLLCCLLLLLLHHRRLLHLLICHLRVLLFPEIRMLQCFLCAEPSRWFEVQETLKQVDC